MNAAQLHGILNYASKSQGTKRIVADFKVRKSGELVECLQRDRLLHTLCDRFKPD
jgi:hypothetical protein